MKTLDFELPNDLSAHEPPEARGLKRDEVRLMVSSLSDDAIEHTRFRRFPDYLTVGDVLVVNATATINAAFEALRRAPGDRSENVRVHLSTTFSQTEWVIELRRGNEPLLDAQPGDRLYLPGGLQAVLTVPFARPGTPTGSGPVRLWMSKLARPTDVFAYSAEYGKPIRYGYVTKDWPLSYYQTVFASEPGSVEMPSAARAFTSEMVQRLENKGVQIVPIILHTGVASLDADEPPYPERYRVPTATAHAVNRARRRGAWVVAVGTTVVRALETVASIDGHVRPGSGCNDLVITGARGLYAVDAMLTGLHAPKASHLAMLEALAGQQHIAATYEAALRSRYLWHEFGDLHLIIPEPRITSFVLTNRSYATC